jgi:hypothetical protein
MLQNLPKDLSETYDRLLGRIIGRQREQLIRRMFEWILCSRRPLRVDEMQEAIAFTIDDVCWDESKIPNDMTRLVRACGNLVVINEETTTLQLAHYTVEQYLLTRSAPIGSPIRFSLQQAEIAAAEVCLAYLSFTDFETQISTYVDDTTANMSAIESLVTRGSLLPNQHLANAALRIWSSVRPPHTKFPSNNSIDYKQYVPPKIPSNSHLRDKYRMLAYAADFWLLHTSALDVGTEKTSRHFVLFITLLDRQTFYFGISLWIVLPKTLDENVLPIAKLGWAIKNNHALLLRTLPDINDLFIPLKDLELGSSIEGDSPQKATYFFVRDCPNSKDEASSWLYGILIGAARQGRLEVFTKLAPFLYPDCLGHITLHAAKNGHLKLVEYLFPMALVPATMEYLPESGIRLNLNALEIAVFQGHVKIAKLLLEQGGWEYNFDHAREGVTALVSAVKQGNASVVEALETALFSSTSFSKPESSDEVRDAISVALRSACRDGYYIVARQLLQNAIHLRPGSLGSALVVANDRGHHVIVNLFFGVLNRLELPSSEKELSIAFKEITRSGNAQSVEFFLKVFKEIYFNPVRRKSFLQTLLLIAAGGGDIEVVETVLESYKDEIPDNMEGTILGDVTRPISEAERLNCILTLKTLIKGAVRTSNLRCLEMCNTTSFHELNIQQHQSPETYSLLTSSFGGKDRATSRSLVEIVLDLKPAAPWGTGDIGGDEVEAPLLHVAGLCANNIHIAETLLSEGEHWECKAKYDYMILYAAVKFNDPKMIEMILDSSEFPQPWKEMALSNADGKIQKLLDAKQRPWSSTQTAGFEWELGQTEGSRDGPVLSVGGRRAGLSARAASAAASLKRLRPRRVRETSDPRVSEYLSPYPFQASPSPYPYGDIPYQLSLPGTDENNQFTNTYMAGSVGMLAGEMGGKMRGLVHELPSQVSPSPHPYGDIPYQLSLPGMDENKQFTNTYMAGSIGMLASEMGGKMRGLVHELPSSCSENL